MFCLSETFAPTIPPTPKWGIFGVDPFDNIVSMLTLNIWTESRANSVNPDQVYRPLVKSAYQKNNFLISQPKHMLWVLKRTVSMRRFF